MIEVEERDDGNKYYWMICNNCHDFTICYDSESKLALEAMKDG